MRDIITRGVTSCGGENVRLTIYYKSSRTSNLIMKNSPNCDVDDLRKTNVVYKYKCNQGDCQLLNSTYIGMTRTRLTRRLTCHLTNGAPKRHTTDAHNTTLTRTMLEEGTSILDSTPNHRRLQMLEALYILEEGPTLNIQQAHDYVLPTLRLITNRQPPTANNPQEISAERQPNSNTDATNNPPAGEPSMEPTEPAHAPGGTTRPDTHTLREVAENHHHMPTGSQQQGVNLGEFSLVGDDESWPPLTLPDLPELSDHGIGSSQHHHNSGEFSLADGRVTSQRAGPITRSRSRSLRNSNFC